MQNLSQFLDRPFGSATEALGLFDQRVSRFLAYGRGIGVSPATCATAIGILALGLIGWVSLSAAPGLNFEWVYLLVCAAVGWLAGVRGALVSTLAANLLQYFDEAAAGAAPGHWVFWANTLVRLAAFASIGCLAAELGRLTRDLERTVRERTARLRNEVAQHEQTADWLQEAVEMFQQVAESISDVVWVTDPLRTEFQFVNSGFEQVWGESRQTLYLAPGTWLERVHPEDRPRVEREMFAKPVRGDYDEEYRVIRSDGSVRWVHDRAFPVKDDSGAVYRVVGMVQDITERKRTDRLLQAERDIGLALSSTSDLSFAVERLLEIALQLDGVECGGVYLADGETGGLHLAAHRGLSGSFVKRVSDFQANSVEARLVRTGRGLYMRQEQIPRSLTVLWGSEGLRALAMVPVQHKGTLLGMLSLGSYRHDEIPPRTRVGLELIACQVAGAIARIRTENSLRQSEAHLRTIINNAPIALLAMDAEGTVTFADGRALPAMGLSAGRHLHRPVAEIFDEFPLALANVRRALAGEEFSSLLEFADTVLECRYTPMRDAQLNFAGCIAVVIDVTERFRLQREVLEISDREQARIGQDIHDGLCQQLIGAALKANGLEQVLSAQQHPEAATVRKLCELLDEAITESRRACRGLYPIRLSTQGLVPALADLATTTAERYHLHCGCESNGTRIECGLATASHLYRIAQEAVNNAVKHSDARNITVQISDSEGGTALRIRDDGKGFQGPAAGRPGMGLHIMEYRARLIGGSLDVRGSPDGTLVTCTLPRFSSPAHELLATAGQG